MPDADASKVWIEVVVLRTAERHVWIFDIELESLKVSNFLLLLETSHKHLVAGEDAPAGIPGARRV